MFDLLLSCRVGAKLPEIDKPQQPPMAGGSGQTDRLRFPAARRI